MKTVVYYVDEYKIDFIAKKVAGLLKKGKIAIIPTDTIYGIVAVDGNERAIDEIYRIKKRPRDKKLIRLIGDLKLIKRYTSQYPEELISKYWPGPLTIVFRGNNQETIALRYPDDPFLDRLFDYLEEKAIVAPSANISGSENLVNCDDIVKEFNGKVEIIVCKDEPISPKASTIIDISNEENWRILRQGELKIEI